MTLLWDKGLCGFYWEFGWDGSEGWNFQLKMTLLWEKGLCEFYWKLGWDQANGIMCWVFFKRRRIWLITWRRQSNLWSLGGPLLRSSSLHTQIITECDWPCAASCLSHQPGWAQGSGLVAFCMPPVTNGFYPWKLQILQSDHIEAITIVESGPPSPHECVIPCECGDCRWRGCSAASG